MAFATIAGQAQAKGMLQNALRLDRLSHAYIFSGPDGTGKREMAQAFAQAVHCERMKDEACGECLSCRKLEHGNHPALLWIEPDGASIKIEQIRQLQKQFAFREQQEAPRIYIITQADRMTTQAGNSLLKFLEEPRSNLIAILITENGQALLPTIRSRAQWIPFHPASPHELKRELMKEGHPEVLVNPAVHLASGLAMAREYIQSNWFAELRTIMIQLAKESLSGFAAPMLTVQQSVVKGEHADRIPVLLDLLLLWFKDMIHIQAGLEQNVVYIDQLDWMSGAARRKNAAFWVSGMENTVELQKRLRANVNPQLALDQYFISIQGG